MLTVPVGVYATSANKLLVVGGGEWKEIDLPTPVWKYIPAGPEDADFMRVNLIGQGMGKIKRVETKYIPLRPSHETKISIPAIDYVFELVKEHPDIIRELCPESITPVAAFLDIETDSTGGHFSRSDRDEILSVQLGFSTSDKEYFIVQRGKTEKEILLDLIALLEEHKPDMVVGYSINRFDGPFIRERLKRNGILDHLKLLDKTRNNVYLPPWMLSRREGEETFLARGLPYLDLYLHAKVDLALKDLPSRTLKNVSRKYGAHDVEDLELHEKKNMRNLLENNYARFEKYSISDLRQTRYLYNIYLQRLAASANLLICPLSMVHRMTSGQKSYIAVYREAKANNYYSVSSNFSRYRDLYEIAPKYQGAIVECYKKGYFPHTVYIDAKSMYPNIMYDFNISYDRYRVRRTMSFEEAVANNIDTTTITATGEPTSKIIYVPDENYRTVFEFEINLISDGFIRHLITRYNKVRDEFKKKAAEFSTSQEPGAKDKALMYDSMQNEAKIINNTIYGIQGNKDYELADLPAAIFITAMGRWLLNQVIDLVGDALIEVDTDGILLDADAFTMSIEEVNEYMRSRIHDTFSIPKESLKFLLEYEGEGSVYMYAKKNYILRKNKDAGKLTIKGSSLTSYDKAPVISKAVSIMAHAIMFGEDYEEARRKALDIDNLPIEDFMFSKTLKKDPSSYKGSSQLDALMLNVAADGTRRTFGMMKKAIIEWVSTNYTDEIGKRRLVPLLKSCKNEGELATIVAQVREGEQLKRTTYFIVDLIFRLTQRGQIVEPDDIIEYYYTRTAEQYTLAQDLESKSQLDIQRYKSDILSILERFEFADPARKDFEVW